METAQLIQPENPMEVMTLFDADAKKLDSFIEYVCNTIESGMDDPLKVLAYAKKMEYVTDRITKRIKEFSERELEKHGVKAVVFGCEMHYQSTYTRYDYSHDAEWKRLNTELEAREILLKTIKSEFNELNKDTGEIVTVKPAIKKQTFGIKTTVK